MRYPMNIRSLFVFSALALSLGACNGDDTGSTETATTDPTTTTPTTTMTTNPSSTSTDASSTSTDASSTSSTTDPTDATTTTTTTDPTATTVVETDTMDTSTSTTGPVEQSCEAYCDLYLNSACGDFKEYDNNEACMAQCNQWPPGEADAVDGDSLGCRLYHATVADSTDPDVHCPHAGPSGDGVCVDDNAPACTDYCAEYFLYCMGKNDVYETDLDACLSACGEWYPGSDADVDGDTVGCRTYHAGAALGDPELHCPHASPSGGGVCVVM